MNRSLLTELVVLWRDGSTNMPRLRRSIALQQREKFCVPCQVAVCAAVEEINFDGAQFHRDIARGIVNREPDEPHEVFCTINKAIPTE